MCELCEHEKLTPQHHSDDLCWAAGCSTCQPDIIVVLNEHIAEPDRRTREHLIDMGLMVGNEIFGQGNWRFDFARRKFPQHYHFHIRKKQ